MNDPRPLRTSEISNVVDFLNLQLRPSSQWSIKDEYPLVFSDTNCNNLRVIVEDGKIVAHAAVKNLLTKTPIGLFNVAAIGSVVTHPSYRNKGLSTKIIEDCLELGRQQKADFALLWTDLYDFYRKMGFELGGSEISIVIENELDVDTNGFKFLETSKVSPEAILKLYSRHTVGSVRTEEDIRKFLNIPNTKVYTAWDQNNNLQAYAIEGKGEDLTGYIHEWGGGVSKLLPLLARIRKTRGTAITIISPFHSQNLVMNLLNKNVTYNEGFLGMIKILDTKNLFFKIRRHALTLGYDKFVIEDKGDHYLIGDDNDTQVVKSEAEMIRLIFGPSQPAEVLNFTGKTKEAMESLFPISMWVWGWDSV